VKTVKPARKRLEMPSDNMSSTRTERGEYLIRFGNPDYDPLYDPRPMEADPSGKAPNEPGAKLDQGKVRPSLILNAMPRALLAVAEVGTFGANKYSAGGWLSVPNGEERYTDAMDRHRLKEGCEGLYDLESGLLHAAHLAWNALARLELQLREYEKPGQVSQES